MECRTIEQLLGGREVIGQSIRTEMDLHDLAINGLSKRVLIRLASNLDMSIRAVSALLNITERTIQRKKENDSLDLATSEQILQVAEVFSRGIEVFGSEENLKEWMNSANMAMGNKKPLELLKSRYGAQMVLDVIGRIENGIIS